MNSIILVGFMGCGKTAVGKALSRILQYHFFDTDKWIEQQQNMKISEIFEIAGESTFRDLETECLKKMMKLEACVPSVIATGGGLPVKTENREYLKQLGTIIYLEASAETLFKRLCLDKTRPLLQTENPRQRIASLLNEREEIYRNCSSITISVENRSIQEVAQEIVSKVLKKNGI